MSKVSIIVVNYNGGKTVGACLEALLGQSYEAREVMVVDNNSSDGSLQDIQRIMKKDSKGIVKLISLDKNTGFAGGNIEGLKHVRGEYVALLNPDAIADRQWLEELVCATDLHSEVGICASKIIVHGSDFIDSAGDGYAYSLKGFKRGEGENAERFDQCEYVFGACAGAALYRKKMIEEIGFLDKDFFLIHEDADLNYRAQLAGWKVLYVPSAIVYHQVRSIIGHMSDVAVYYTLRNSEFVRIKNVPIGVLSKCLPEVIISAVTEFMYFGLKHKKFILFFRAKMDALKGLPGMLKKRGEIMKIRRANTKYLLSVMTSVWEADFLKSKINKFFYA